MQQIEFRAMGCLMHAVIDSNEPEARAALAQVPELFETWEQCLSRFRDNSELSLLNCRSGQTVPVSETLWEVTQIAVQAAAQSEGIVTPTVLNALEAAGYDLSLSGPVQHATQTRTRMPTALNNRVSDWRGVRMDRRRRSITLPPGVRLDLAGVAKGWAAEQAVRYLGGIAPAMVEASGDIAVSGPHVDGSSWTIDVEHPFGKTEELPLLMLLIEGVATSTRGYRRWMRGDKWMHHLIDPRTGRPAETDVYSATVVAPTLIQAEVAAKVALILGSECGMDWIEQRPELSALLILEDATVLPSRRLKHYCWNGQV